MAQEKKTPASKASASVKKRPSVRKKKTSKSQALKKELIIFSSVIMLIAVLTLGYFLGRSEASSGLSGSKEAFIAPKEDNRALLESLEKVRHERVALTKKVSQVPESEPQPKQDKTPKLQIQVTEPHPATTQKNVHPEAKKSGLEILEEKLREPQTFPGTIHRSEHVVQPVSGKKPRLVIIIDDVSSAGQINMIRSLGLKLTPSIFPPYQSAPASNKLAKNLEHYMVHLPMESGKVFDKQAKTLRTTDTKEQMEARIKEIRALFPTARFINNHTGSVFTANAQAMETIYPMFKEEGFVFIDSRTIGKTVVPQVAKENAQRYLSRDVFIDNSQNIASIHMQLRQAVLIAKKRGYAIAIGHPHKTTIAALGSAHEILKDVDVVYIDELYESLR